MTEFAELFKEPIVQLLIWSNLILFALIVWQKSYFSLAIARIFNKTVGAEVTVRFKDGTFQDYLVPDVRKFDWKGKAFGKLFEDLPDWVNKVHIPNTPYSRNRRTGFPHYEFNEDAKEAINPYDRQPDLSTFEADAADLTNAFDLGRKWEKLKASSGFNRLVLIFLVINMMLGAAAIIILNQQNEAFKNFGDSVQPIIDRANKLIEDFDSGRIKIPGLALPNISSTPPNQVGTIGGA